MDTPLRSFMYFTVPYCHMRLTDSRLPSQACPRPGGTTSRLGSGGHSGGGDGKGGEGEGKGLRGRGAPSGVGVGGVRGGDACCSARMPSTSVARACVPESAMVGELPCQTVQERSSV